MSDYSYEAIERLESELMEAESALAAERQKREEAERNWYDAKAEFGAAIAKAHAAQDASEAAQQRMRVALEGASNAASFEDCISILDGALRSFEHEGQHGPRAASPEGEGNDEG